MIAEVKLGETVYKDFITSSATGAATDADSTPTCEVFEDNTDTATLTPTVVKRTGKTGNYRIPIAATTGNGFEANKSYNVIVSATVGGVAAKSCVESFIVRANIEADTYAAVAALQAGLLSFPVATVTGTPTTTTVTVTGLADATANAYKDSYALFLTGGNAFATAYPVTSSSYSGGTTTLTFAGLLAAPSAGDTVVVGLGSKK